MFRPHPNQRLQIGRHIYRFLPHPATPAFPYGQEGRMATVYKLIRETAGTQSAAGIHRAFKVFKAAYRTPQIEVKARELRAFARMPGLQACTRRVISPQRPEYQALLKAHPDLAYAVLMPWVPGETWGDVMLRKSPLQRERVWNLAWSTLYILLEMEKRNMAHCDLAAANVMVDWRNEQPVVALVDVEQLYAPNLTPPDKLLVGSPGYMPHFDRESLWGPLGDRFAGAVLLAEMLAWYHPEVVRLGNEQSYFKDEEMHTDSERFRLLIQALQGWSKTFADLFRYAWLASSLHECPPLALWYDAFQGKDVQWRVRHPVAVPAPPPPASPEPSPAIPDEKIAEETASSMEPTSMGTIQSPDEAEFVPEEKTDLAPRDESTEEMASTLLSGTSPAMERVDEDAKQEPSWAPFADDVLDSPLPSLEEDLDAALSSMGATERATLETDLSEIESTVAPASMDLAGDEDQEQTQIIGLEDGGPFSMPSKDTVSRPEEHLTEIQRRAQKHATLGLIDQALQYYRQAIDLAVEYRLPQIQEVLSEYNHLIFRQIDVLEQGLYRDEHFSRTSVQSLNVARRLGYWLGGLRREQLALIGIGAAITSFVLMIVVAPYVQHPFWASLSLGCFLLAFLLPVFQRPPVVTGLYTVSALFGLMAVNVSGKAKPQVMAPVLVAALGAGAASWLLEDVFRFRLPKDWLQHMLWSLASSFLTGMLVDEIAYPESLGKFNDVNAWVFNLLLAVTGWYLGYQFREILLAFRESRMG